jgi:hypothetical protein
MKTGALKDTSVELDVAMIPYGQVSFELTRPLPQEIQVEELGELKRQATIYPALAIAIPENSHNLPILRLDDSRQFDWPVVGLFGRRENEHEIFVAKSPADVVYPFADQFRQIETSKPIVFRRHPDQLRGDVFRSGKYDMAVYITFSYIGSGDGEGLRAMELFGASNLATLPDTSRATIEVVEGRRTHLRITPPDKLETVLREEIAKTLGDVAKIAAEQQKPRPVQLEAVGQTDMFEPEKLELQPRGGTPGYGTAGYGGARDRSAYGGAR